MLKSKKFKYHEDLLEWVNKEAIEVISITGLGKFEGEGYRLFYRYI